jgi:DNA-binding transcriptional MocR family regulator
MYIDLLFFFRGDVVDPKLIISMCIFGKVIYVGSASKIVFGGS